MFFFVYYFFSYPCCGFTALPWLATLKPCVVKAIEQLKYQTELNFQLYAPSVCVLRSAPQSAFRRILVGYLNEFSREKSSPLPGYSPFLFTALPKAHCEGIEVAQDSSKFHNSRETQTVEKRCCSWDWGQNM
jgi:hypothetical protein